MEVALTKVSATNRYLHDLADELCRLIYQTQKPDLDSVSWRTSVKQKCEALCTMAAEARDSLAQYSDSPGPTLDKLLESLAEYSEVVSNYPSVKRMKELSGTLSDEYEELRRYIRRYRWSHARELRHAEKPARLLPLKPINYHRNLFHAATGIILVLIYELFLTHQVAIICCSAFVGLSLFLEVTRRIHPMANKIICMPFKYVIRPWEFDRPNSASWYGLAVFLVVLIMPKAAVEIGVMVLAIADPLATIIGKKFGRKKLYGTKTIVGSLAFFSVALITASIMFTLVGPSMPTWKAGCMLVSVALAGALTELGCQRLDDNFAIPTITAGVATLWMAWPL